MGTRGRFCALLAVLVGLLVSLAGASALHGGDYAASEKTGAPLAADANTISVKAVANYGYQPDTFENIATNATITVTFTDADVLEHSFNISSREGFQIPSNYSAAQLNHLFGQYPPLYSATVESLGDVARGTFHSPVTPGWYEFICNETGHFQMGMFGFVAFGEALPNNLTLPNHPSSSPGSGPEEAAAVVGGLLVGGGVAILWWRRRRATYRLPPGQQ